MVGKELAGPLRGARGSWPRIRVSDHSPVPLRSLVFIGEFGGSDGLVGARAFRKYGDAAFGPGDFVGEMREVGREDGEG